MQSDFKAVVLDVDGTLCSLTHGVGEVYAEVLAEKGFSSAASNISLAARHEWREFQDLYLNTPHQNQTTHAREREVWLEYVRRVLARAELSEAIRPEVVGAIYQAFASKKYRAVEPGAVEFLKAAREAGLMVVAATNNDLRTKTVLQELGVSDYLSHMFVAGDLLWKKPSVHFFTTIATLLGVEGPHILHVGNDLKLDIEPARRAGWSAIMYGANRDESESVSDYSQLRSKVLPS